MSNTVSRATKKPRRRPLRKRPGRDRAAVRLFLTPGEPAGIGPDLALRVAQRRLPALLVAVADPELLRSRASLLRMRIRIIPFDPLQARHRPGTLPVLPVLLRNPAKPGELDTANADYVLDCLRVAVRECRDRAGTALVTGPVQKSVINDSGVPFSGHTEFLAELTGCPMPVMLLASGGLRVALATTHLPLREVPDAVTRERLAAVLRVLDAGLRSQFGIARPRIRVAGLNPHAGEGGHLGREDVDVVAPAVREAKAAGLDVDGPWPADTLFTPRMLRDADAVLAMYHDQGLPVLKHAGFGEAVNVTLGLPLVRTSVDHGTALDLAGTGKADPGSLLAAIELAARLARRP